jgi:hypothetical protein
MLRKSLLLALGLLSATASVARAGDVIEPYPQTAPPVQVQPVPTVQVPPPAPPQYDYSQYPPPQYPQQQYPQQQYPQQQYYPPPGYAQPNYVPGPPPRFRTIEQPRYGLMTAGLVVFGASWSINALSGYLAGEWRVAVPIAGPLMYAHSIDNNGDFTTRTAVTFLVLDALVETAGAAMFLAGLLTHHQVRVMEHAKLNVVPTAGIGGVGVAAFGRF